MTALELRRSQRVNPLDSVMTKAQVVRRKFKSALPRIIQNRVLTELEAMARTMELFDKLRGLQEEGGLSKGDVSAGVVFCQPETPGKELIEAQMIHLPSPEKIGEFVEKVMALDKPLFLGVLFAQIDREAKEQGKPGGTVFVWPFMGGPKAEHALIGMRNHVAELLNKGGLAAIAN